MENDNSEIVKLTERIAKDPKSKLFVSLAEEHKKAGDAEMAISVLREGLKNNPGYVTAKSFLGKLLFETGDLAGAQAEFEEVVKSIPDNLMAQRKLGDIYALQDKASDALSHYKLVLSINPRDEETASLVADIEAGHDVKSKIVGPTHVKTEEALNNKQSAAASSESAVAKKMSILSPLKPGTEQAGFMNGDEEEAEEVLFVEPLDADSSGSLEDALSTENLGFMEEPGPDTQEGSLASFDTQEPVAFEHEEGAAEGFRGDETLLGGTAPSLSESDKQSDDFTTDTLAELYITQGFFEKAIEIYDRLLADNPESKGLKDKLAKVRAMAANAGAASGPGADEILISPAHEFIPEHVPDIPSLGTQAGMDDELFPSLAGHEMDMAQEDALGTPATSGEDRAKQVLPEQAPESHIEFDTGFEPVEYVPPDAAVQRSDEQVVNEVDLSGNEGGAIPDARKPASTGRKETIDRLENWLHQIMKEK